MNDENLFIRDWKNAMLDAMCLKYGKENIDFDKVDTALNAYIRKRLYDPEMRIVNNYKMIQSNMTFTRMYTFIRKNKPIIGGNGVLFRQHSSGRNPLADWIAGLMSARKAFKKEMFKAEQMSYSAQTEEDKAFYESEANKYNLLQLNTKIKINSLYGVLGYAKFMFYNIFLAQCVTATGQNVISTAACAFEAFIADGIQYLSMAEVRRFVKNCILEGMREENSQYLDSINIPVPTIEECIYRIKSSCAFKLSSENEYDIECMIRNLKGNDRALKLILYKNNLQAFYKLPYFSSLIQFIMYGIDELMVPQIGAIKNPEVVAKLEEFMKYMTIFVLYEYPFYDRVRRNKYQYKKAVIYEDTDSNFLSLFSWVDYVTKTILSPGDATDSKTYIAVNIFGILLTKTIESAFATLAASMNIDEEHGLLLQMKNEFYYSKVLFVKKKKRYIGLQIIQEGNILNNGAGKMDVKGFDFKKSTTKPSLRKFYEKLSYEDIMLGEIDTKKILTKIMGLESDIRKSLLSGDNEYFKQSNIKRIADYATPYSIQGIKAVVLWNTLCPDYQIELPGDVDIVPIKLDNGRRTVKKPGEGRAFIGNDRSGLPQFIENNTRVLAEFERKYPNEFFRLRTQILENEVLEIRKMKLNCIAKPKNPEIPIPQWFYDIMDMEKITNDGLKLFNPVMDTLGIRILKSGGNNEHYSNMISL